MTTTHLFVELLVIGFGALIWFFLILATILGVDIRSIPLEKLDWTALLFPMLSLSYVLGIVTDRAADILFSSWEKKHRQDIYGAGEDDKKRYFEDRRFLLVEGAELWQFIEYGRSRLRICRGWALNGIFLFIAINLLWVCGDSGMQLTTAALAGLNLLLLALTVVCTFVWARLHFREYKKIQRQSQWLRKHRAENAAQQLEVTGKLNLDKEDLLSGEGEA